MLNPPPVGERGWRGYFMEAWKLICLYIPPPPEAAEMDLASSRTFLTVWCLPLFGPKRSRPRAKKFAHQCRWWPLVRSERIFSSMMKVQTHKRCPADPETSGNGNSKLFWYGNWEIWSWNAEFLVPFHFPEKTVLIKLYSFFLLLIDEFVSFLIKLTLNYLPINYENVTTNGKNFYEPCNFL